MKRLVLSLILALLVLSVTLPAAAQDAPASCVTDLSPVAAQLMTAQALASSGDTAGSVAQLREVRAALAAIQAATRSLVSVPAHDADVHDGRDAYFPKSVQ